MKKLLRPKVVLPIVLLAVLLGLLPIFGDVRKIAGRVVAFRPVDLLLFLLLMVVYEAVRGVQWHVMLRALGVNVPLRTQIFSFLGGEVTKSLPIGNYFQNYLLQQSKGTDFGLSSAATTLVIWTEVLVSLVGLVVLGVPGWDWLRPLIIGGSLLFVLLVWLLYELLSSTRAPRWMREYKTTVALLEGLTHFREGAVALLRLRVLASVIALSAIYLVVAGVGLYVIARGLSITGLPLGEALAVYFFSLGIGLIIPIPIDLGLTEISGIGVLLVLGVGRDDAVAIVLLNRILSALAALLIAFVGALFMRGELRAVLRGRPHRRVPTSHQAAEDKQIEHEIEAHYATPLTDQQAREMDDGRHIRRPATQRVLSRDDTK